MVSEPSIAADAGVPALSTDDAVASAPRAIFVSAAASAGSGNITVSRPATSASVAATAVTRRFGRRTPGTGADGNPVRQRGDLVAVSGPAPSKDLITDMQPPKRTALPTMQAVKNVSRGEYVAARNNQSRPIWPFNRRRVLADTEDQPHRPRWTMVDDLADAT